MLNKLLKDFETFKEMDKYCKETTGYTVEEIIDLKGEEFDKVMGKLFAHTVKLEKEYAKKKELAKMEALKKKTKPVEDGAFFKVYQVEIEGEDLDEDQIAVAVEGQGELHEILGLASSGLGQIIAKNIDDIKDVDAIIDAVVKTIKQEIREVL